MTTDLERLLEEVRCLVAEQLAIPIGQVVPSARLDEDLGTIGDDAAEFMEEFARRFSVDLEGLDLSRHVGPEGSNPLWLVFKPRWLRELGSHPVTVNHLVEVALRKKWFDPPRVK